MVTLWFAMDFRDSQEVHLEEVRRRHHTLNQSVHLLEAEARFRQTHAQDIATLREKGWLKPISRLVAAEWLERLRPFFKTFAYTFEPEGLKMADGPLKATPFILEGTSSFDREVYESLDLLLEKFPGVLIPREIVLVRSPQGIESRFVFEWMRFDER